MLTAYLIQYFIINILKYYSKMVMTMMMVMMQFKAVTGCNKFPNRLRISHPNFFFGGVGVVVNKNHSQDL